MRGNAQKKTPLQDREGFYTSKTHLVLPRPRAGVTLDEIPAQDRDSKECVGLAADIIQQQPRPVWP